MKQVFFARHGSYQAGVNYTNPFGVAPWQVFGGGEDFVKVPMCVAGTLRNLIARRSVAPGVGNTQTFTLRKNGADTAIVANVSDTNTVGVGTGDVSVAVGDFIAVDSDVSAGSPAASIDDTGIEFEGATPRQSIYPRFTTGGITSGTHYNGIFRGAANWGPVDGLNARDIVGIAGRLTNIYIWNGTAPGSGKSIEFTVMVNGVAQDGSGSTVDTRTSVTGSTQICSAAFSLPLVPGDEINLRAVATGGPASDQISFSSAFIADVDGYSNFCGHNSAPVNTGAASYSDPLCAEQAFAWDTTEGDVEIVAGPTTFELRDLIVKLGAAPGPGAKSFTFSGRVNGTSPGGEASVTIADTATSGSAVGVLTVTSGDTYALQAVPSGTPGGQNANWVFGLFIPTSVGARVSQLVALLVQDRDPDPAVTTPPTGGGTVPAGIDPDPGIDLCPVEVPIAFMDITPPGGSTTRYSAVPINVTVADQPRVQSFGSVTRALVKGGEIRGSSASAVLIDTDRALRGLEATDSLPNSVVEYYISSEAGIKARAVSPTLANLPRRVFSGLITDSEPLPELRFRIQATDYLQALLDTVPLPTYPQRVFSVADFPNLANDPKSPTSPGNPSLIGKPIPIGYGLLSDESKGLLARGVVPAFFVGKRLVDGFDWDEYVVFGHAPSPGGVLGFFGDVTGGVSRDRFDTSFEGVDFLWPGHAGWTAAVGPALYRDFNGNRYTVIYARGPRSDSAREMRIPFSINIGGVEATGDGTGLLIESLPLQILHLLINFVLQNYTSGTYLAPPLVNGYSRVKTSSFTTVKNRSVARMGGSPSEGWLGAFLLGWDLSTVTLRDIARMASEHGLQLGTNKDGQIIASTIDPLAASVRNVTDITDTIEKSFQARRQRSEIRTQVAYRYERRYVPALPEPTPTTGEAMPNELRQSHVDWEVDNQAVSDATAITKYQTRVKDIAMELTRDADTADDLAAYHLEVLAPGPVASRYREGLCATNIDLGDNHELTHFEGITSSGWTDQLLRCEQHRLDLDRMEVEIDSLDIADL